MFSGTGKEVVFDVAGLYVQFRKEIGTCDAHGFQFVKNGLFFVGCDGDVFCWEIGGDSFFVMIPWKADKSATLSLDAFVVHGWVDDYLF